MVGTTRVHPQDHGPRRREGDDVVVVVQEGGRGRRGGRSRGREGGREERPGAVEQAVGVLGHTPSQGLSDELVPEADADHPPLLPVEGPGGREGGREGGKASDEIFRWVGAFSLFVLPSPPPPIVSLSFPSPPSSPSRFLPPPSSPSILF
jgi:hypothetical protein